MLYAITQSQATSSTPLSFYGLENTLPVHWTMVVSVFLSLYPPLHKLPGPEWLHYLRGSQDSGKEDSNGDMIDSALLDYVDECVCRRPFPRLSTTNLRNSVSSVVSELVNFDYSVNEDVLRKYIHFITA